MTITITKEIINGAIIGFIIGAIVCYAFIDQGPHYQMKMQASGPAVWVLDSQTGEFTLCEDAVTVRNVTCENIEAPIRKPE